MAEGCRAELAPPRFERCSSLFIAGLRGCFTSETMQDIPAQWQRFAAHIGKVPGQIGWMTYGLIFDRADIGGGFEYLSGVEVFDLSGVPGELSRVRIPAQSYAVFRHRAH